MGIYKLSRVAGVGLLVVVMAMAARPLRGQAGSGAENNGSIEGIVVSLPSGAPLRHANVQLLAGKNEGASYAVETDSEGRFTFSNVVPGEYRLVAKRSGYKQPTRSCNNSDAANSGKIALTAGQKVTDARAELLAPAAIEGTVYDENGDPLGRASLRALRLISNGGKREFANMAFAESDDRGHYRIFYLEPGQYYITVGYISYPERPENQTHDIEGARTPGFLPIYYGDTTDPAQARTIDLKAGDEFSGADLTVRPAEVLRVRGRVLNGITGTPMKEVFTTIHALDPALGADSEIGNFSGFARGDGTYQGSNLIPGRYTVVAFSTAPIDHRQWGGIREIELTDSSLNGMDVRVFPGEDVQGEVGMADGGKLPETAVRVALVPRIWLGGRLTGGEVKADGSFLVSDATPGTYDVRVMGLPPNYFVKSARMGTLDVLENGVRIGGGGSIGALDVRLSAAAGQLDGNVTDSLGKAACGGEVVLIPEGTRRTLGEKYPSAGIDLSGHFTIHGIAAGDYRAFAWEDEQAVAYREPAVWESIEGLGTRVHFDEGDKQTLKLQLITATGKNP
jgi:Carboxypeptidase regulatory-like domain